MRRVVLCVVSCLLLAAATGAGSPTEDEDIDVIRCTKGKWKPRNLEIRVQFITKDNVTETFEPETTILKEHDDCTRPCYLPWPFVGKCTKLEECDFVTKRTDNVTALSYYGFNCTNNFHQDRLVCCTHKSMKENKVTFKQDKLDEKHKTSGDPKTCSTLIKAGPPNPDSGCCGREVAYADHIVSGHVTRITQFPWMVYLMAYENSEDEVTEYNNASCGGSLISSKFVLTAAHCFHTNGVIFNTTVKATLGEYYLPNTTDCVTESSGHQHCVQSFTITGDAILHEQFSPDSLHNDIALVKLHSDAPYTDNIRPICLPTIDIDTGFYESPLYAAGWGRTAFSEETSSFKLYTTLNHLPRDECALYYGEYIFGSRALLFARGLDNQIDNHLDARMLCAQGKDGAGTCQGDSGGPIMTFDVERDRFEVAGITSYSYYYCGFNPAVYTNVYRLLPWIHQHVKN